MQQRPPPNQPIKASLLDLLQSGLVDSIELEGFKGKITIRIEAIHIEVELSQSEPVESQSSNGEEGGC
jgi:hypothetical protein